MKNVCNVECNVGDSPLIFESGKLAKLADGAVTVSLGETLVLVTAVSQHEKKENQGFFPLSVEYKEKAAAAGAFPGGYFKREGRPTEKEILTARLTDRPLRPLFPKGYLYDTQIIALLLSADKENDSDILCMNGASAALCVSDIPFAGPLGAVRIGKVDGKLVVNPTFAQRELSSLNLLYGGVKGKVVMIEGDAGELAENEFNEALDFAQEQVEMIISAQEKLAQTCGKEKRNPELIEPKIEILNFAREKVKSQLEEAIYHQGKMERDVKVSAVKKSARETISENFKEIDDNEIKDALDALEKECYREGILQKNRRADGRGLKDLRSLGSEAGVLPRTHGSAIFSRGETSSLALATLASLDQRQNFDNYAGGEDSKSFILHYNFPPFSVGETGRMGGINRREIGHGNLAERSFFSVLPKEEDFPYAIRVTSEIMESNGSTSMATVSSATMALLDAGVPLKSPVGGISVGLVSEFQEEKMESYQLLLDIIGSEDFFGDMDFKLCATKDGITSFQLDLKLAGIPLSILKEAISLAGDGVGKVLDKINETISAPSDLSPYAPKIEVLSIDPKKIGELIGPGGKNIKAIQAESGADVQIEEDGTVRIYSPNEEGSQMAKQKIEDMFTEIEVDKTYTGKIVSTTNFGAFMEVLPGKDGLIHISELAEERVGATEDVVKVGDIVTAKCIGIDEKGRVKMSLRAAS